MIIKLGFEYAIKAEMIKMGLTLFILYSWNQNNPKGQSKRDNSFSSNYFNAITCTQADQCVNYILLGSIFRTSSVPLLLYLLELPFRQDQRTKYLLSEGTWMYAYMYVKKGVREKQCWIRNGWNVSDLDNFHSKRSPKRETP